MEELDQFKEPEGYSARSMDQRELNRLLPFPSYSLKIHSDIPAREED